MRPLFFAAPIAAAIVGGLAAFAPASQPTAAQSACDPHYVGICLPVYNGPADDVDCTDPIITIRNFPVIGDDPHGLDGNPKNGIACEGRTTLPVYQPPTATPTATATTVPPTATATATSPAATATSVPPTATATATSPTATATSIPPTVTATTAPPTATTAPATATATRTTVIPGPPNTGTGTDGSGNTSSLAALGAIGATLAIAGGIAAFRKRNSHNSL